MPSYHPTAKYDIPHLNLVSVLYRPFKTSMNPRNRGFWDLKLTGEYYSGISFKIQKTKISFKQTILNDKNTSISNYLKDLNIKPLGISDENLYEYLETKKPKMQENLMKIINNGLYL